MVVVCGLNWCGNSKRVYDFFYLIRLFGDAKSLSPCNSRTCGNLDQRPDPVLPRSESLQTSLSSVSTNSKKPFQLKSTIWKSQGKSNKEEFRIKEKVPSLLCCGNQRIFLFLFDYLETLIFASGLDVKAM